MIYRVDSNVLSEYGGVGNVAEFLFSNEWNGRVKTAVFDISSVEIVNNKVTVPPGASRMNISNLTNWVTVNKTCGEPTVKNGVRVHGPVNAPLTQDLRFPNSEVTYLPDGSAQIVVPSGSGGGGIIGGCANTLKNEATNECIKHIVVQNKTHEEYFTTHPEDLTAIYMFLTDEDVVVTDYATEAELQAEATARANADAILQSEIDALDATTQKFNIELSGILYVGDSISASGRSGISITGISSDASGIVTVNLSGTWLPFEVGDVVSIAQITPVEFEGRYIVKTKISTQAFTIENALVAPSTTGTLGRNTLTSNCFVEATKNVNYITHADVLVGNVPYVGNTGVSGNRVVWVLEEFDRIVAPRKARFIHVLLGINDLTAYAFSDVISNYKILIDKIHKTGATPICGLITPVVAPYTNPAVKQVPIMQFNTWLRKYCTNRKIPCVDYFTALANKSDPMAYMQSQYTADGLHPNFLGNVEMGKELAKTLTKFFDGNISYAPTTNAHKDNLLLDALQLATPKTSATGAYMGTYGSEMGFSGTSGYFLTLSMVARSDGFGNNTKVVGTIPVGANSYVSIKQEKTGFTYTATKQAILRMYSTLNLTQLDNGTRILYQMTVTKNGVSRNISAYTTSIGTAPLLGNYIGVSAPFLISVGETVTLASAYVMLYGNATFGTNFTLEFGRNAVWVEEV